MDKINPDEVVKILGQITEDIWQLGSDGHFKGSSIENVVQHLGIDSTWVLKSDDKHAMIMPIYQPFDTANHHRSMLHIAAAFGDEKVNRLLAKRTNVEMALEDPVFIPMVPPDPDDAPKKPAKDESEMSFEEARAAEQKAEAAKKKRKPVVQPLKDDIGRTIIDYAIAADNVSAMEIWAERLPAEHVLDSIEFAIGAGKPEYAKLLVKHFDALHLEEIQDPERIERLSKRVAHMLARVSFSEDMPDKQVLRMWATGTVDIHQAAREHKWSEAIQAEKYDRLDEAVLAFVQQIRSSEVHSALGYHKEAGLTDKDLEEVEERLDHQVGRNKLKARQRHREGGTGFSQGVGG